MATRLRSTPATTIAGSAPVSVAVASIGAIFPDKGNKKISLKKLDPAIKLNIKSF